MASSMVSTSSRVSAGVPYSCRFEGAGGRPRASVDRSPPCMCTPASLNAVCAPHAHLIVRAAAADSHALTHAGAWVGQQDHGKSVEAARMLQKSCRRPCWVTMRACLWYTVKCICRADQTCRFHAQHHLASTRMAQHARRRDCLNPSQADMAVQEACSVV